MTLGSPRWVAAGSRTRPRSDLRRVLYHTQFICQAFLGGKNGLRLRGFIEPFFHHMYAITTTPGFIIESRPRGEAGKLLSIFTRDLGLVLASAQGIRLEKSKLRYHSQEYSFGEFSFVRGKEFWRLTSANGDSRRSTLRVVRRVDLRNEQELIGRIALLLRRLLHGEEPHPELFEHLEGSTRFLFDHNDQNREAGLSIKQFEILESIIVFRILHLLGYIGNDKNLDPRLIAGQLSIEFLDEVAEQKGNINRHINKALKESHL